ncbi:MAG: protein-L-isoaspartate(D-aspartate) O-methyltransferase [Sedimentisphaerales bacterium]|nr:protein-L-isoaspartate(D-aspartate) O-methyltransferase [Sedimentisphaerales bacterium]
MIEEYPETSRKQIFVLLFLLILLGGLAIYFAFNTAGPNTVVAEQDKGSDVNEPYVEPNQPTTEPNKPNEKLEDPNDKKVLRPVHRHRAYTERVEERSRMVDWQIEARSVKDPNVLSAMRTVPRHAFVRPTEQNYAYTDNPLPIGYDQTISQPYIVAFMTEALKLTRNSKVLEIGTGSGYQAAVCAEIAQEVYSIEIVEELAKISKKRLKELGYRNVFTKYGDGFFGWPEHAPFDTIIGTAAAGRIPEPLIEQLTPGGRMILPYGSPRGFQYLVLVTKDKDGKISRKNVMPVRFVPMTGEVQKSPK